MKLRRNGKTPHLEGAMSEPTAPPTTDPKAKAADGAAAPKEKPSPVREHTEGLSVDVSGEDQVDATIAAIEMTGEETATGFHPPPGPHLAHEVLYLHYSRTIHQLVTDRNRAVGIFLFVASVLIGASSALLNAHPAVDPIVPLRAVQYWCFPITFGTLSLIALFISLILIRTRIGLIFEVAKMNALLGLPATRVKRVNPLSIFFLMHLLVVVLGGACGGLTAGLLAFHFAGKEPALRGDWHAPVAFGLIIGVLYMIMLQAIYYFTILHNTADQKLREPRKPAEQRGG
jgi:hypothetical protein